MKKRKNTNASASVKNIHKRIVTVQIILIVTLALFLGISGTFINLQFEIQKRDQNLQNIAEAVANSPLVDQKIANPDDKGISDGLNEYLDSLKTSLDNIDVISFVSKDNVRLYHSNHELINTKYDGTIPDFESISNSYYTANESGPSGSQRRAYSAVYDENGNYTGFVMAIMLLENIKSETAQTLLIYALITLIAIIIELVVSAEMSSSIKKSLYGYEPDVFSAMFRIRDDILESLNEGLIAVNKDGIVQFANQSAVNMLGLKEPKEIINTPFSEHCNSTFVKNVIVRGEKKFGISEQVLGNSNILLDCIPIKEEERVKGVAIILHNRAEYTKLMEDLSGTRYLVDSMRANNHDFTNKLHVIMGLIQMEMYDEAVSYIENISIVQRQAIGKIMAAVDEPAIAALLIGKSARASELNIKFKFQEESHYSRNDMGLSSEMMVTVIGNLIDNAFEAMNLSVNKNERNNELRVGIYSKPNKILLIVEDTGVGISEEDLGKIFDKGFSTKGEGRGTGLYQIKDMIENAGGRIYVDSKENKGTIFTVIFEDEQDGAR